MRKCFVMAGALALVGLSAQNGRAGVITVTISDGGVDPSQTFTGDSTSITISGATLAADFSSLRSVSSITASSNILTEGVDGFLRLQLHTVLNGAVGAPNRTFIVTASETDYTVPVGDPKTFTSTASFSFVNALGDSASAQGGVDPLNVLNAMRISGGVIGTFSPPDDLPNSFAGNGTPRIFTATTFSLTDQAIQGVSDSSASDVNIIGRVDAGISTPEPTTILSLLAGVPIFGFVLARHRRKN